MTIADAQEVEQEVALNQVAILLREGDEVAVAKTRIEAGTVVVLPNGTEIRVNQSVPPGHKFALTGVAEGEPVRKYGQVIGYATRPFSPETGCMCRIWDLAKGSRRARARSVWTMSSARTFRRSTIILPPCSARFAGFARPDGRVGTRNYVALVSTVNCSASTVRAIADRFRSPDVMRDFPGVDGVVPLAHKSGCGQAMGSADYHQLQRTLSGMADHPNVGAYLLAGLGCEVNQAMAMAQNGGLISAESLLQGRPALPPDDHDSGSGRHPESHCAGRRGDGQTAEEGEPGAAHAAADLQPDCRHELRRQRWQFRRHGKPGPGHGGRRVRTAMARAGCWPKPAKRMARSIC